MTTSAPEIVPSRWHPVSISGYHIREAGSTAAQELAFTLKDGLTYVEQAIQIAKYRAARRIWARELRETFGASNPKSWLMRFHTQTAGVSLTAQQPLNTPGAPLRDIIDSLTRSVGERTPA